MGVGGVVAVVIDRLDAGVKGVTAGALVAMAVSVLGMWRLTLRFSPSSTGLLRSTAGVLTASSRTRGGGVPHPTRLPRL